MYKVSSADDKIVNYICLNLIIYDNNVLKISC